MIAPARHRRAVLEVRVRRDYHPVDLAGAWQVPTPHGRVLVAAYATTDAPPGAPGYVVTCEHHGALLTATTKRECQLRAETVAVWCTGCREGREDRLAAQDHPLAALRSVGVDPIAGDWT